MKTRNFRMNWRDWRALREIMPGIRGETMANYMGRVTNKFIIVYKELRDAKR